MKEKISIKKHDYKEREVRFLYKENRNELRRIIQNYLADKKPLVGKINLSTLKQTEKLLKKSKNDKMISVNDVIGYHHIMNTKMNVIYSEMSKEHKKKIDISIATKEMKVIDAFRLAIHLMNKDFKVLLSEKYFDEYKKYKMYGKIDTDNIIFENLKDTISLRKKVVEAYISFVYGLYKKIPELIREYRKDVTKC